MSAAVAAILGGMPDPADLHVHEGGGQVAVMAGNRVLSCYPAADAGMRNMTVVMLTQLGFAGKDVAAVMGLTPVYVSMLRSRAREQGSAGLVRDRGRPAKLGKAAAAQARRWREQDVSDAEIGRRLGVHGTTIGRALGPADAPAGPAEAGGRPAQEELGTEAAGGPHAAGAAEAADAGAEAGCTHDRVAREEPEPAGAGEIVPAAPAAGRALPPGPRLGAAYLASRYAGAMLLHAFFGRVDAGTVLATAGGPGDVALLTAASLGFALGASSVEGLKHLIRVQAGPLAGLAVLPELRTLRPRLAAIADACDPLGLQTSLARAMLAADAPALPVYFVDDHFVPYCGAKPVMKGWNTKRRHAQKGRADTLVTDYGGRAVCFVTGEPSGLAATLPPALAELKKITGGAQIMLGFDRGGAYPQVFRACRQAGADWITYRRAPLAPCAAAPRRHWTGRPDAPAEYVMLADETVTIDGYGTARQLSLFEDGKLRLQILTSDLTAPAAALAAWLRCRWRIENAFKYLSAHHGIDWLCGYTATLIDDERIVDNPARKAAGKTVKAAEAGLAAAERNLAQLLASTQSAADKNKAIPAAQDAITRAQQALAAARAARDAIPAKIAVNQARPGAQRALLHARRRGLQMVLRLLAANAELWLAGRLNAYLRDPDEYRAITRHLLHQPGHIAYHHDAITVTLDPPASARTGRALACLIEELNATPPRMPGDPRPITYRLAATS
ncbi:MAG TPA: transposase [Streptosporangiaceae bacterium]|nr:transposase [Streptosporangiaceae bacterium]